jgi:glycosyltransferase involved in cell wall biosynthesis
MTPDPDAPNPTVSPAASAPSPLLSPAAESAPPVSARAESAPAVSAIVPARNEEATIARAVASLAAQPEIAEIIVVNDESTDHTAAVLEQLLAREPKLRVLAGGPLPAGWIGKNHACWEGAQQATGGWLLFTDADAVHLPGSTARALADAEAAGASLVSYSPEQEMHTWWERALIPFVYCRLAHLYPYAVVNDPRSPVAAANGQYLLIRRDAYQGIGGHAAVSGEVLEDVALACQARAQGVPLHFASGAQIARVRMYASFRAMWEGWTKNLCPLLKMAGQGMTRELLSVIPWIPLLCLALAPLQPIFGALGILLLAGRHASYAATLRRNRLPVSSVVYYLAGVALYCAALLVSDARYARGKVTWKGREYPVGSS